MLVIGQHSPPLKDSPTQSVGQAPKVCTSGGGIVAAKFEMPSRFFTGGRPPSFLSGEFPLICNSDFIVFPLLGRSVVLRLFARSLVGFGSTAPSSFLSVCLSAPLCSAVIIPFASLHSLFPLHLRTFRSFSSFPFVASLSSLPLSSTPSD